MVFVPEWIWETFVPAAPSNNIRLAARATSLEGEKARLEERVQVLEVPLRRISTNSSKPPSTDRPKVQKKKGADGHGRLFDLSP